VLVGYTDAPPGWWREFVLATPAKTAKLAVVRANGAPHVAPVWVDLDDDQIVFMTSADTIKGKAVLRDPRVSLCWDDEQPPFAFVTVAGTAQTSTDPDELLRWATRIGGRYMGPDRAEEYGQRNAVPPEMLIRITPSSIVAKIDVAD
jgi:PPOX class probable F420-dependent enzyme